MLKSLLWKEWREQRWKLAFGCVMLMGVCAIGLHSRMTDEVGLLLIVCLAGANAIPLLAAMGIAATDREERSLNFTLALPCSRQKIFCAKFLIALLICIGPLLGAALVWALMADENFASVQTLQLFLIGLWLAVALLIWTAALAMRQPTEARVGLVGLGVVLFWIFSIVFGVMITSDRQLIIRLLQPFNPFFVFLAFDSMGLENNLPRHLMALWQQALLLIALTLWAIRRFNALGRIMK